MSDLNEKLILVDSSDNQIGIMEKMEAHKKGLLHRAVSVFIFNSRGEFLLQQRAHQKYHSPGLWSNTCCTHPFPNESTRAASNRRLMQEMGLKAKLSKQFHFIYKAPLKQGLTEHELDHVFMGICDELPNPNAKEVINWKYISYADLEMHVKSFPEKYTVWFQLIYKRVQEHFIQA